jgi:flagellar hook-associated protein 3 FlgL
MAWMDVTEGAYNNVIDIMKAIKDRCIEAANGTLESSDRQAVAAQLRLLVEQLGTEMNITYAGRYVFSGFRTNEPPICNAPNSNSFEIHQDFTADDIEATRSYQKLDFTGMPTTNKVCLLKLAYALPNQAVDLTLTGVDTNGADIFPPGIIATPASMNDPGAYDPPIGGKATLIKETGEIVLSPSDAQRIATLSVQYEKTGFEAGELNPIVYFSCKDLVSGKEYNMENQDIAYEFSVNTDLKINSHSYRVYTDKMYADLKLLGNFLENVPLSNQRQLEDKFAALGYSGAELEEAANKQMADEKATLSSVLHDRFNNMLAMCDRHMANISKEHTDLGARMNRLDLILTRLEQDEGSYKKLMSDNEDVDMMEAIMLKSNAEATYQASLKAGASIIQMTLSNFI